MKLIISRKGLDGSAGGFPNPLLPSGQPLPLPIPDHDSPIRYGQLWDGGWSDLLSDLGGGKISLDQGAHLDPDLDEQALPRKAGWRPLFGQHGAAASHLDKHDVGPGDLFLFYGWFRAAAVLNGRWRFVKGAPDLHLLYGWFQVDTIVDANGPSDADWMEYHPHFFGDRGSGNRIFTAGNQLTLPGEDSVEPAAGLFQIIKPCHLLTEPGASRSRWLLPAWFHPDGRQSCLSYHEKPHRWSRHEGQVRLQNVARGQEFVLDCNDYPEAISWAAELITEGVRLS